MGRLFELFAVEIARKSPDADDVLVAQTFEQELAALGNQGQYLELIGGHQNPFDIDLIDRHVSSVKPFFARRERAREDKSSGAVGSREASAYE